MIKIVICGKTTGLKQSLKKQQKKELDNNMMSVFV